jgi:tetratricopeptide (TPR) repeat protein
MKITRKLSTKSILLLLFVLASFPVSAQPWWYLLEQGKHKFRQGEYGEALISFESARRQRLAMYEQMEKDFIILLSLNEVRRLGDSLDIIEKYAADRNYFAASAALKELFYRVPKDQLNNSALTALEAIGKLKDYPEAEYWIGETYLIEGELSIALSQFKKAYAKRSLLENSGFSIDLSYKIASVHHTGGQYAEMQEILNSIISEYDNLWTDSQKTRTASFAVSAMNKTLVEEGPGRFLELYRYNNAVVEQAHRRLGLYLALTGRKAAQEHLMFSFLIQNTIIIEEIKKNKYDFTLEVINKNNPAYGYQHLLHLSKMIKGNKILELYVDEVEYYRTAYYFAENLFRNGLKQTATQLWSFLAAVPEAGQWQKRAVEQLKNPHEHPIVANP